MLKAIRLMGLHDSEQEFDRVRARLLELAPQILVDTLLELADHTKLARLAVERLAVPPSKVVVLVNERLDAVERDPKFLQWNQLDDLEQELLEILKVTETGGVDPEDGIELMTRFFELDRSLFNRTDGDGTLSDVFLGEGSRVFRAVLAGAAPERIVATILELIKSDGYGIRGGLTENVTELLDDDQCRELALQIETWAQGALRDDQRDARRYAIRNIAIALRDPDIFLVEGAATANAGKRKKPTVLQCTEYAALELECERYDRALEWIDRIPKRSPRDHETQRIELAAAEKTGDTERQARLLTAHFLEAPSLRSRDAVEAIRGEELTRALDEKVLRRASRRGRNGSRSTVDWMYLCESGRTDRVAKWFLEDQERGDSSSLFAVENLAQFFEQDDQALAAIIANRVLVSEALDLGRSRTYAKAAHALQTAARLSRTIEKWGSTPDHAAFIEELRIRHGRKRKFWGAVSKPRA